VKPAANGALRACRRGGERTSGRQLLEKSHVGASIDGARSPGRLHQRHALERPIRDI